MKRPDVVAIGRWPVALCGVQVGGSPADTRAGTAPDIAAQRGAA